LTKYDRELVGPLTKHGILVSDELIWNSRSQMWSKHSFESSSCSNWTFPNFPNSYLAIILPLKLAQDLSQTNPDDIARKYLLGCEEILVEL